MAGTTPTLKSGLQTFPSLLTPSSPPAPFTDSGHMGSIMVDAGTTPLSLGGGRLFLQWSPPGPPGSFSGLNLSLATPLIPLSCSFPLSSSPPETILLVYCFRFPTPWSMNCRRWGPHLSASLLRPSCLGQSLTQKVFVKWTS